MPGPLNWLRHRAGMVTALGLLGLLGGLVLWTVHGVLDAADRRAAIYDQWLALEQYKMTLRLAEGGQRGYLVSGRGSYLADYRNAVAAVEPARRRLAGLGIRDPDLDQTVDRKLAELAAALALFAAGQDERARAVVAGEANVAMLGEMRRRAHVIETRLADELTTLDIAIPRRAWATRIAVMYAGLVAVVIILLSFAAVRAELAARTVAEAALRNQTVLLTRSNSDLEQFAYGASHDLQEPLRMITGFAQLLEQRYAGQLDDEATGWIARITDGARRMQRLIDDLLIYARLTTRPGTSAPVPLADVVAAALDNLQSRIVETGATVNVAPLPLPAIAVNATQATLAMQNLIGNAIKYRHPDRPPMINVRAVAAGRMAQITVEDNGIGIEPKYFAKIFEMFTRVGVTAESGTGIGLAIVRRVAERHGGTASVKSIPGEGSIFTILLPLAELQP